MNSKYLKIGIPAFIALAFLFTLITTLVTAYPAQPQLIRQVFIIPTNEPTLTGMATELITYTDQIDTAAWQTAITPFAGEGILLALTSDTTAISAADRQTLDAMGQQAYLLDINSQRVLIVGNTTLAVQHGMFDFLEQMGSRFLAPPDAWQIIPQNEGLDLTPIKRFEEPDIAYRDYFHSGGLWGWWSDEPGLVEGIIADNARFDRQTRMHGITPVEFGHAYEGFVDKYESIFKPEWFGMYKDDEGNLVRYTKNSPEWGLAYCNEELIELFVQDRIEELEMSIALNPNVRIVSMEPNDGAQSDQGPECEEAIGGSLEAGTMNTADEVIYLNNQVAISLTNYFTNINPLVGTYAYNNHIGPPIIVRPEPNVYVQLTMDFNTTDLSFNELVAGWKTMGAQHIGIYDYNGIPVWDHGFPKSPNTTFKTITESTPYFINNWQIDSVQSETSAMWGRLAPSMYLYRKLQWDGNADAETIYSDFFTHAFGSGAPQMRELFNMWEDLRDPYEAGYGYKLPAWLAKLDEARIATLNDPPAVQRRIDDMIAYIHFVRLYNDFYEVQRFENISDTVDAALPLMQFTFRIRRRQMVQVGGWAGVIVEHQLENNEPIGWRDNGTGFTSQELRNLLAADILDYPVDDPQLRTFSNYLVPISDAAPVPFVPPSLAPGERHGIWDKTVWHVYVDEAIDLTVDFDGLGMPVRRLWVTDESNDMVLQLGTTNRLEIEETDIFSVTVMLPEAGVYRFEVESSGDTVYPVFSPPVKFVYEASAENPVDNDYFTPGYFYVPEDTENLLIYHTGRVTLKAPSWTSPQVFGYTTPGLISVPVGDDAGKVWSLESLTTAFYAFLNIPPYIATAPENLLVPATELQYFPLIQATMINTNDLRLQWLDDGGYSSYTIWRDVTPYFTGGTALGSVSSAPWLFDDTGVLGNASISHYYHIEGNISGGGSRFSKRVGEFEFDLVAGNS